MTSKKVIVVGSGPAGKLTALEMRQMGLHVPPSMDADLAQPLDECFPIINTQKDMDTYKGQCIEELKQLEELKHMGVQKKFRNKPPVPKKKRKKKGKKTHRKKK